MIPGEIPKYKEIISSSLPVIYHSLAAPDTHEAMKSLIQDSTVALRHASSQAHKIVPLSLPPWTPKAYIPPSIYEAHKTL